MAAEWTDMEYPAALAYLRSLQPMTEEEFALMDLDVQQLAFVLSRVTKLDALQWVVEKIAEAFEAGYTIEEFAAAVDQVLADAVTDEHTARMVQLTAERQYGAGRWEQGTTPELVGKISGWDYHTMQDDRVRDEHAALDGRFFRSDDAAAFAVFPPWDFGCRCQARWRFKQEVPADAPSDALPDDVVRALGDSDYSSPALQIPYQPDLSGFDPRLLTQFNDDQAGVN